MKSSESGILINAPQTQTMLTQAKHFRDTTHYWQINPKSGLVDVKYRLIKQNVAGQLLQLTFII